MNRNFVKTYLDRFKEYPDYMAEETYAGVYFLKAAIERAGTTDSDIASDQRERACTRRGACPVAASVPVSVRRRGNLIIFRPYKIDSVASCLPQAGTFSR